jgi:hypothetical protein
MRLSILLHKLSMPAIAILFTWSAPLTPQAYELATLTGTQVFLLVVSETGTIGMQCNAEKSRARESKIASVYLRMENIDFLSLRPSVHIHHRQATASGDQGGRQGTYPSMSECG